MCVVFVCLLLLLWGLGRGGILKNKIKQKMFFFSSLFFVVVNFDLFC